MSFLIRYSFDTGSHSVVQVGPKFTILLLQLCWDLRCAPPYPAQDLCYVDYLAILKSTSLPNTNNCDCVAKIQAL